MPDPSSLTAEQLREELTGARLFETPRLRCRRWRITDLEALFAVYADEEGARWVGDGTPITWDECQRWLHVTARNYRERGYGMFVLEDPGSGAVVGFCGLVHPGGQADAEIKYAFLRSHWGRGLASEMAPALLAHGHQRHGLSWVIATVAPENLASQRVLEKAGMIYARDILDDDGQPTRVYHWSAS